MKLRSEKSYGTTSVNEELRHHHPYRTTKKGRRVKPYNYPPPPPPKQSCSGNEDNGGAAGSEKAILSPAMHDAIIQVVYKYLSNSSLVGCRHEFPLPPPPPSSSYSGDDGAGEAVVSSALNDAIIRVVDKFLTQLFRPEDTIHENIGNTVFPSDTTFSRFTSSYVPSSAMNQLHPDSVYLKAATLSSGTNTDVLSPPMNRVPLASTILPAKTTLSGFTPDSFPSSIADQLPSDSALLNKDSAFSSWVTSPFATSSRAASTNVPSSSEIPSYLKEILPPDALTHPVFSTHLIKLLCPRSVFYAPEEKRIRLDKESCESDFQLAIKLLNKMLAPNVYELVEAVSCNAIPIYGIWYHLNLRARCITPDGSGDSSPELYFVEINGLKKITSFKSVKPTENAPLPVDRCLSCRPEKQPPIYHPSDKEFLMGSRNPERQVTIVPSASNHNSDCLNEKCDNGSDQSSPRSSVSILTSTHACEDAPRKSTRSWLGN